MDFLIINPNESCGVKEYDTPMFTDVWEDVNDFMNDFLNMNLNVISENSARTLYYLIYGRFGNSPIAQSDVHQWKYKFMTKIFAYGPTWEKKLDIQEKLRGLSDEEIAKGAQSIHNHAYNPSGSLPATRDTEELPGIDDQSTSSYVRSKIDSYANLWNLLATDVTESFIDRFRPLFMMVPSRARVLFKTEEE